MMKEAEEILSIAEQMREQVEAIRRLDPTAKTLGVLYIELGRLYRDAGAAMKRGGK